jgi:hypothetical protein
MQGRSVSDPLDSWLAEKILEAKPGTIWAYPLVQYQTLLDTVEKAVLIGDLPPSNTRSKRHDVSRALHQVGAVSVRPMINGVRERFWILRGGEDYLQQLRKSPGGLRARVLEASRNLPVGSLSYLGGGRHEDEPDPEDLL